MAFASFLHSTRLFLITPIYLSESNGNDKDSKVPRDTTSGDDAL